MRNAPEELTYAYFEAKLRIDRNNLDREIEQHAEHFQRAMEQSVLLRSRATKAKDWLVSTEATVRARVLRLVERKNGDKRVDTINGAVQTHADRETAFNDWVLANQEASRFEGLVEAFRQRGYMLRELTQLMLAGLLESRSVRGPVATEAADAQHAVRRKAMAEKRSKQTWRSKL